MSQQPDSEQDYEKNRRRQWDSEHGAGGFTCAHCSQFVVISKTMGTLNRNHCNHCFWSKHVDEATGDRRSSCNGGMQPIGLTFKHEGQGRVGEIMLIHLCSSCQKLSINRIARDDPEATIEDIFKQSLALDKATRDRLAGEGIYLLSETDQPELSTQLYGK
jgi:RNHCP domain